MFDSIATHNDDLSGDEEADSDGCEVDDPGGDAHHHHRHRREEVEQGAPLLPARRDGDPGHDAARRGNIWCLLLLFWTGGEAFQGNVFSLIKR